MGSLVVASNTEIRKVYCQDLGNMYPDIYKSVFEESDPFQMPTIVYLGFEDGMYKGFISGYLHNAITLYMQYAGIIKNKRGYKTLGLFREALKEIDKEFLFIMVVIKNDNITALKIALNEGFIINGVRQDTGKNLYVELVRKREG